MDTWDEAVSKAEFEDRIHALVQGSGFLLFFKYDKSIFGAGEEARIVFARLKHPEEEVDDQASFSALNLSRAVEGSYVKSLFDKEAVGQIKVISGDKASELVMKHAKSNGIKDIPSMSDFSDDHEPKNFMTTKE